MPSASSMPRPSGFSVDGTPISSFKLCDGVGQISAFLQAHGLAQAGIFGIGGAFVEAQDVWQEDRIQRAMVQLLLMQAARCVGEGVHTAKALHKGEGAFIAGHHHMPAGVRVGAVLNSFLQPAITERAVDAVIANTFRRRIDCRGQNGLDTVRHGIHAGRSRQAGGQAECQVRIADGGGRDQVRRDDGFLAAILQRGDQADGDFRPGAGRRRNGDQWRDLLDLLGAARDGRIGLQRLRMADQQADGFGMVHGRAAADRDQAVCAASLVGFGSFLGLGFKRVRNRVGEDTGWCHAERVFHFRQDADGLDARVRDDKGARHAQILHDIRQLLQRAGIKNTGCQEVHNGHGCSSSNTALALLRGQGSRRKPPAASCGVPPCRALQGSRALTHPISGCVL